MDGTAFDALTRALSTGLTRRRGLGVLVGLAAGAGRAADSATANGRRTTCRPTGSGCTRNSQCCTGTCETRRTVLRSQRNRCICIPDCDGKTCGPDGCGGSCGDAFPLQCSDEGQIYSVCEDFDVTLGDFGDAIWCEGSVDGTTRGARANWYPWGFDSCASSADCQLGPACSVAGYGCHCEATWTDWETGEAEWDADGATWCQLYRSKEGPCYNGGVQGMPGCSETIEGQALGVEAWAKSVNAYAGYDKSCSTSAECVALDVRCTSPDIRCVCELGWGHDEDGWNTYDGGYCQLHYLTEG